MSLPWHIPLEGLKAKKGKAALVAPTLFEHYLNINIHENPTEEIQTGIMCEIGLANREPGTIQKLIAAGMTVAKLNVRDLDPDACAQLIQSVRQAVYNYSAELEYVYPLALIIDVRGPDIVTGGLKGGPDSTIDLIQNNTIRLTTDSSWRECGTADCLYVGYDHLTDLQRSDLIYIDGLTPGKIKLIVTEVGEDSIECLIAIGGTIGPKMTTRISEVPRDIPSKEKGDSYDESLNCSEPSVAPFEHMDQQIAWAIAYDVDGLLVPNTQNAHDIRAVKELLSEKGKHILVIACIDTILGFDNIDEILAVADGIYLDRCNLCTELPVEKVCVALKIIVSKCSKAGKPYICKVVLNEQIPTLCVTDMSNIVLDGADVISLELHYASPLQKFSPMYDSLKMAEHCIAAAGVVCRHMERIRWQPFVYGDLALMQTPLDEPTRALCISATELAMRSRAVVLICLTNSGRTPKLLVHAKPFCPIVAVTRTCHTSRQLRFWRGVRAVHYFEPPKSNWMLETEARVHAALDYCKAKRILRAGDAYVLVKGSRHGVGHSDTVRLLYATARNTVNVE